ncbi:MAG: radical SAM protein [Candidatus Lokiarchaeota archaeon]|nr:radical SAM protein [Candidatus Lokiarchaeota archaeon]
MKYVYGPVPSRRLGRSLGIDPIPSKTCDYQCIYCQLGKTTNFTSERKNFYPLEEIYEEIEQSINKNKGEFDYITFVGSGEPTLCKSLGKLILKAKELSKKPICVITNGSLLYQDDVKDDLIFSDVVLPTLDAGDEKLFIKINRPHPSIKYEKIIQGYIDFRKEFNGKFWIEIMVMKGINDSREELFKIKKKIDLIQPDRIDINVPIRPPTESWVKIPDQDVIPILNDIFGDYNNINFPEQGTFSVFGLNFEKELKTLLERHPMRLEQITETFSSKAVNEQDLLDQLNTLASQNKIKKVIYNNQTFWKLTN